MNQYLEKIILNKKREITERKSLYPVKLLERSVYFPTIPVSMKSYLTRSDKLGVIAEFKRKSPSKGWINQFAKPGEITLGYMQSGASALSVLTDKVFFDGSFADLTAARTENYCPILQKDFILDEYQIIEAKSIGADCVLLIAAVLSKDEIKRLADFAHSLKLEVLLEIHTEAELEKVPEDVQIIGINNRNLETFEVDLENAKRLLEKLPNEKVKVAESGIHSAEVASELKGMGFDGLLIGEQFMKTIDPVGACRRFIRGLEKLEAQRLAHSAERSA
jgi:indole-3-glycerol phosphate synthase